MNDDKKRLADDIAKKQLELGETKIFVNGELMPHNKPGVVTLHDWMRDDISRGFEGLMEYMRSQPMVLRKRWWQFWK